jgi:hypothetical protein
MDSIDHLVAAIVIFKALAGCVPGLWKADIDSAYRRIPVAPEHRWAAWIAFIVGGVPMAAGHLALMFGGIGSVHGWDRVGALLRHIARVILRLPVCRYVDDYFGVDHPECAQHAMECFARMVRAVLGPGAVAPDKLAHGVPLEVLGLQVRMADRGVELALPEKKRTKWMMQLANAKLAGVMPPGDASKLAGRLGFAACNSFMRAGRAMLRPFFAQQYAPMKGFRMSSMLMLATEWWLEVLQLNMAQTVEWSAKEKTAQLLCDARGSPARIAAVLLIDGEIYYTDMEPSKEMVDSLCARNDNQIMAWELLSIALGVSTFGHLLRDRRVRIWSDNVGAKNGFRAGAAHATDHNLIIHALWLHAMKNCYGVWIARVASAENLADLPSRESYRVLEELLEKKKYGKYIGKNE